MQTVAGSLTTVPSGTQSIDGSVTVTNFPATQAVSGTVIADAGTGIFTIAPTGVQTIVGSVSVSNAGNALQLYNSVTAVASGSQTAVVDYTPAGGTMAYINNAMASASGGPCKVIVQIDTNPIAVGFFSSANPFINFQFGNPLLVNPAQTIAIYIQNDAAAAQNLYATLIGATMPYVAQNNNNMQQF